MMMSIGQHTLRSTSTRYRTGISRCAHVIGGRHLQLPPLVLLQSAPVHADPRLTGPTKWLSGAPGLHAETRRFVGLLARAHQDALRQVLHLAQVVRHAQALPS